MRSLRFSIVLLAVMGVAHFTFAQAPSKTDSVSTISVPAPEAKSPSPSSADAKKIEKSAGEEATPPSVIQIYDLLDIEVFNEPDLTKKVKVDGKGFINYPLLGRLQVVGLSREDAEIMVRDLLSKDYLVNPVVSLRRIVDSTAPLSEKTEEQKTAEQKEKEIQIEPILVSYVLLGQINRPGTYEYDLNKGKMTLLRAISIAGGFSRIANMNKIKILRREEGKTNSFMVNGKDIISGKRPDIEIQADDLILVPESLI
jgi:protein involved in polysaccharide export with SLBB domain